MRFVYVDMDPYSTHSSGDVLDRRYDLVGGFSDAWESQACSMLPQTSCQGCARPDFQESQAYVSHRPLWIQTHTPPANAYQSYESNNTLGDLPGK